MIIQSQSVTPTASTPLELQRQTSTGEGAVTPPPEAPSEGTNEPGGLSQKYAIFAKKEKALRSKYSELKAREDAIKAKEAEYANSYVPKQSISERLSKDPYGFLTENGVTSDQIALMALNQPSPQDTLVQKLQTRIEELEGKQTQTLTKMEEQQKRAYEQAVQQIRNEAKVLVDSNPDFETIKESGQAEAVVELIKEIFDHDGVILSVEEAAKEVETYLIEEAYKMAQLKKVKAKLFPQPEQLEAPEAEAKATFTSSGKNPAVITEKPQLRHTMAMRTLTNSVTPSSKPLSPRERAIMAFKGQLK